MTLLSICQNSLQEIGGIDVPNSFVGNTNLTARRMLASVKASGNRLEMRYDWVELIFGTSFTTESGTSSYARDSDFRKFANMTQWDRTNNLQLEGPISPGQWAFFKGSVTGSSATITRWFRVRKTNILIHPTPTTTGDSIHYEYFSKNWILLASDSTKVRDFEADSDTLLLDEDLVRLDAKWRFLKSNGNDFEAEYREFEDMIEILQAQNGGSGVLRMDSDFRRFATNVPEGNYTL